MSVMYLQHGESSTVVAGRWRCDMPDPMASKTGRYVMLHCARCSRYAMADTLQAACEKWNSHYDMPVRVAEVVRSHE